MTVYAKWNSYSYTVTFDKTEGDTAANPASITVASPATTIGTLPAPPTRTGYIFDGWNTASNGSGNGFDASTTVSANTTVYAQWNSYSYTVTFNNSGGDTAANPASKTVASPATTVGTLPVPPSKAGYVFGGWYTGTGGTGDPFTASTTVTGSMTVYAKWATGGLITLNPDAGDGAFSQADFTISKSGTGYLTGQTITITGSGYSSPRWLVDGTLKGTGASITIEAADYAEGGHSLSLFIIKDGAEWSKGIEFTVSN
jgi:uncharacterized repeat protein (TIGR02543 family)